MVESNTTGVAERVVGIIAAMAASRLALILHEAPPSRVVYTTAWALARSTPPMTHSSASAHSTVLKSVVSGNDGAPAPGPVAAGKKPVVGRLIATKPPSPTTITRELSGAAASFRFGPPGSTTLLQLVPPAV
jgi:hypothetical protein